MTQQKSPGRTHLITLPDGTTLSQPNQRYTLVTPDGVETTVDTDGNGAVLRMDSPWAVVNFADDGSEEVLMKDGGIRRVTLTEHGIITEHTDGSMNEAESVSISVRGDTTLVNSRNLL